MKPAFSFKLGKYTVKIADTEQEFQDTYRLRYETFYPHVVPPLNPERSDKNIYDEDAHLIIVKDDNSRIVGTYRLRCSHFTDQFYASTSFEVAPFFEALKGQSFVELTRACIEPSKRQGVVIIALWRGILSYLEQVRVDYLFGCVSLLNNSPAAAFALFDHLKEGGHVAEDIALIQPVSARIVPRPGILYSAPESLIPPLFAAYLKMGTKVHSLPAYDGVLRGFDFFCALRLADLNSSYIKRFSAS